MRSQEETGGDRRSQEEPGGARRSQEEPAGARGSPWGFLGAGSLPPFLKSRSFEGVPGSPGESQKEGRDDQGTLKQPPGLPPGLPFGSSLGSP